MKSFSEFIKSAFGSPKNSANFVGAESFSTWNPGYTFLNQCVTDEYATAYPSIRAIANEYMAIQPFAIDANGKEVRHDAVDALYHPNQMDSSVAFFEKIAVSTLSLRKTYLLIWRREGGEAKPGGDFTRDTIAGYTFLEFPGITRREGHTYYNIGSQEFTDQEVIVLPGGVDPKNLYGGYSPSEASRRWAKLDDYIADYQAGFFENGAVPAGQFMITAATAREYNDTVDMLQARHRGAGKNGNVTYSHRPIDPNSGKPAEAQIEWVPFSQANKDIDFKNLFEQTNRRIDVAYGVPQIVKGVDDAATYANAQVAEKGFAKRAVYPLALRNYTQITHELNRITNGLGIAITFKYVIPTVADEEKVEAETKQLESNIIRTMVTEGYSLDSVVDAFGLSNSYKLLKSDNTSPKIDNDKPDVDEGGEVHKSPDPSKVDGTTPLNRAQNALSDKDVESYEFQLADVVRDHTNRQIEKSISELDTVENAVATEEEVEEFVEDMLVPITSAMVASGTLQYEEGLALLVAAELSLESTSTYSITEAEKDAYRKYLLNVGDSYMNDTTASIRAVLARANEEGWTRVELETALRNIINTDQWRISRLATSEINRSQSLGSVYSMRQIQSEVDATIERSLLHTGSDAPCEFCASYIDNWTPVGDNMINKNDVIKGADGGELIYTWDDNEGHDVHANGHCVPQYRVVRND